MRYEQIEMQFEEICDIVTILSNKKDKEDLNLFENHDIFIKEFSEIVCNYNQFLKLMEKSAMPAKEIFVIILAYTGCNVKQLTKPMTRELRKALKTKEIK